MNGANATPAAAKRFRARRLLAPTAAAVFGLALFWIVVPGDAVKEYRNFGDGPSGGGSVVAWVDYEHGWPFVYLWRRGAEGDRWSFTNEATDFRPWALVSDVGIALLVAGVLACMSCVWVRRVKSLRQFTLSSVLVGFLLAALVLGWWRTLADAALGEQALIRRIESLGGTVETGFAGPVWLRKLVGGGSLRSTHRVVRVALFMDESDIERLADEGLKPDQIQATIREIPSFTHGRELELVLVLVTDQEVAAIGSMPSLRVLNLSATQISDDGLRQVSALRDLEDLSLIDTKITDRGLEEIAKLRKLQCLDVSRTGITDAGLKHLAGLTELESLEAQETLVTEKGAQDLESALPGLSLDY